MALTISLAALLVVACIAIYGYAYYHGNRKPDNSPSHFLKDRGSRRGESTVVVCVGDSITHGRSSCNYVDILARRLGGRNFEFVNAGINSELSYNVLRRLDEIIQCSPDYITILVGTNDSNKSLTEAAERKAIRQMGLPQRPAAEWFRSNLLEICRTLKARTRARIAVLSIPLITEDIHHPAFRHSRRFVDIIKEVAEKEELTYLPLRERMEAFIEAHPSSTRHSFERRDYLVRKAFAQNFFFKKSWDDIAIANGFNLLTDFVHLSCRGAEMAAELIEGFLVSESETGARREENQ